MADTETPNIGLTIQTVGGNVNTWGTKNNDNFDLVDDKFGDRTAIVTTGGTTTLIAAEEVAAAIDVSGVLGSAATIAFSGAGGFWIIRNGTTGAFSLTAKVTGQTGVIIPQGSSALIWCNGTDILTAAVNTISELSSDLDTNGFFINFDDAKGILDDSDNEQLIFQKTASAVNYWEMTNAATGNAVLLQALGGDTDVAAKISSKGAGQVQLAIGGTNELLLDTAALFPATSDGSALGKAANPFSDLFLASGSVIDWAGDITLTHSANVLTLAGGGVTITSGDLILTDNLLTRALMKDYAEEVQALGSGGGTKTFNFENGNVATLTGSVGATTLAFSNWPTSGKCGSFTIIGTNLGSQAFNFPAAAKFDNDITPTLTAAGVDIISGFSIDAGTTIYFFVGGQAMA